MDLNSQFSLEHRKRIYEIIVRKYQCPESSNTLEFRCHFVLTRVNFLYSYADRVKKLVENAGIKKI